MSKPKIAIGALGGTICMSANGGQGGVKPSFSAEQLVGAVPALREMVQIEAKTLLALPSGSLKIQDLVEVYKWAKEQIAKGAVGVVITQGTDTLEESAFFLNLVCDEHAPLVITGAMRNADSISSDGAGNIYASVLTAISPQSRDRGVLVVLNDTIHSALWVHKSNTFSLQTFVSINAGIQGLVIENEVKFITPAVSRQIYPLPDVKFPKVEIIQSYLGCEGEMVELALRANYSGIIISGVGAGHVSYDMVDKLRGAQIPVVVASRTGSGICATKTYGYKGSEMDLQNIGCIMSGWLSPIKSRLLLMLLLANNMNLEQIKKEFGNF